MYVTTEVFKAEDKKLIDFFKAEKKVKTITFNVLDAEMTDFEFPTFEDSLLERNDKEENKVFLNKMFFIDFDMPRLTDEQKTVVEKYLDALKDIKRTVYEITQFAGELRHQEKKFAEAITDADKKRIEEIKTEYLSLRKELESLKKSDGTTYEEKKVIPQERDYTAEDKRFIEFYKPLVEAAYGAAYDLEIMKLLKSDNNLKSKRKLRSLADLDPSGKMELDRVVSLPQYDKLEKMEEKLEIEYERTLNIIRNNNGNISNLRYEMYTQPLKEFKEELKNEKKEKIKLIEKELSKIANDYRNYCKENPIQQNEDKIEITTHTRDNRSQMIKISEKLGKLNREYNLKVGNNIQKTKQLLSTRVNNYRRELNEIKSIKISDIPYLINKDKLNIFLLNLSRLNLFESTVFGFGHYHLKKDYLGIEKKFNLDNEVASIRSSLNKIISNLPEAVTETDKINRNMIEEIIVNNYQTDVNNKSQVDLFIDNEFLFKVSFDWSKKDPELVFTKADREFAIPNIVGSFDDFKVLDIKRLNTKLFQMFGKSLQKDLDEQELLIVFNAYSAFVTENYDKIVEARYASILKVLTILNHGFIGNPINQSLFINPLAGDKFENLYEHIPIGKLDASDLLNDATSDNYYSLLLNYHSGIETHWEKDEDESIKKIQSVISGFSDGAFLEKNIRVNIDLFFDRDSSLLPLLVSENIYLKEELIKTMSGNILVKYKGSKLDNINELFPEREL